MGDGANDLLRCVFEVAGLAIGFEPKPGGRALYRDVVVTSMAEARGRCSTRPFTER